MPKVTRKPTSIHFEMRQTKLGLRGKPVAASVRLRSSGFKALQPSAAASTWPSSCSGRWW